MLTVLKVIVAYRSILFPALMTFVGVVVHAVGWSVDVGKVQAVIDAAFGLLTAVSVVVGGVMDANNAKVRAAVNENAKQLDQVTPPSMVAARIPPAIAPPTEQKP
jgi:hypothetical protein